MIRIYIAIALVVAMAGAGLYIRLLHAQKAALTQAYAIAAQTAIDNKDALETAIGLRRLDEVILSKREEALRKLEKRNDLLNRAIDDLARSDTGVRSWSDTLVPDAVGKLLNTTAAEGGGGEAVPAGKPDPAKLRGELPDPHQR